MNEWDETDHKLELQIQRELVEFLRARGWYVERMLGTSFQFGIPDLYAFHRDFGHRWIEVKRPYSYSFTLRQRQKFPAWEKVGIGIWILSDANESQYALLFGPPNWRSYWRESMALPDRATVDAMVDELVEEHERLQAEGEG
ncbi:MAG: hypothetical protein ABSG53_15410 [Thermoguttaceae bacterium]|jgi:hypothetical protein